MFLFVFYKSSLKIIKFWTNETPMRKNFGSTKYPQEKILDPRNTHEKKFETPEIPTRKYFGPTKYPREKFSDPRRHDGTVAQEPRWHETHRI